MERCHSVLLLPQGTKDIAKRNLVKISRSDGEASVILNESSYCEGNHDFKSKKRKTSLSKSVQDMNLKGDGFVVPSTGNSAKRKMTRVPSQDDLWKSIQTNYTFLMADDLIAECQETRKELYLPSPSSICKNNRDSTQSHQILNFEDFLEKFNEIHDILHSMQTSASLLSENEYEKLYSQCQYFKEQASLLKLMYPDSKDDINRRCNILSNKLDIIERMMFPQRSLEKNETIQSLTSQMKNVRKWLQEMEGKLRKLKCNDDCETDEMAYVFNQEKILQREIEGRGKELTSLIRQCDSLEGATVAESKRLRRAAAHLERSWHNIWIRSLEKQCLTEQRLLQRQSEQNNHREASDFELDEGPLNKHRRLTLDRWTAVNSTANMDKMRMERNKTTNVIKTGLLTKDIGVLCSDLIPVNDKCIMVGTTGIAALKAEYGDDFTNFEIIQDVGYSSESSTHLSSDDGISVGGDRYFNIRVYNYADEKTPPKTINLKEELDKADSSKQSSSLASSVGSSSGAPSFDDSGLGAADLLVTRETTSPEIDKTLLTDDCDPYDLCLPGEESDFLETVLDNCVDFCTSDSEKDGNGIDDLQYNLSGIESDDSADNFHNKKSFTTSSQLFYKMILVDSENEEEIQDSEYNKVKNETLPNSELMVGSELSPDTTPEFASDINENVVTLKNKPFKEIGSSSTDSEQETYKAHELINPDEGFKRNSFQKSKYLSSTPIQKQDTRSMGNSVSPNLKRKRDTDCNDFVTIWEGGGGSGGGMRVRSWLKRCSKTADSFPQTRIRRCLFRSGSGYSSGEESTKYPISAKLCDDLSSCDASGEYTSSSADEGNALSSSSSFFDDDPFHFKERLDSYSGEGSVETVIRGNRSNVGSGELLPPPLSSTPSCLRRRQCASESMRCCDGPFSNHSCADLRWFVMKASSEGDLRTRSWHMLGNEHSLTNFPSNQRHKSSIGGSCFDFKQRLSSSLPNVLRHRSDSSTDDTKTSSLLHSDSKTYKRHDESFISHNQSSSSDFERKKKRRSRRRSSSSNRSSRSVLTSSEKGRLRSRTLTSRCSSRRRNLSQKSDFFEGSENNFLSESEGPLPMVHKIPREELSPKNLKEELELALKDNIKGCHNSTALLSPAESDIVLTRLEEQSTVSDQVWDGYQDMPYLSEAYSEATVDEDAIRKLTEFGDDYGSAIGQSMRFLDSADACDIKMDAPKSPSKKSSKSHSHSNDSDSDLEDLHHVIEEAGKALQFARATLKRRQSGDFFSSAENAELLATCGTHLHWLQTILEHIEIDGKENCFSESDLKELHYLVGEWKCLKKSIEMYEEVDDDKIKQKYLRAQENIDALFHKMSELDSLNVLGTKEFKSWEELHDNISRLQLVLSTLQDTREQLLAVNLQVHRFVTEYGNDAKYADNSLKEEVTELYQKWEDIYEQNGAQLTELETLNSCWKKYIDTFHILNSKLNEAERLSSYKNCDTDCHIFEDEVTYTLLKDLKQLKADAESLKKCLKSTETWKSIQRDLRDLESKMFAHIRPLSVSRSGDHPNSSSVEDDPDDHFEDAIQQIDSYESLHSNKVIAHHLNSANKGAKKKSRFWRIIRVAVPVQLTLVLLFCLACYLEPNCCDRLNNFNFSFTPHLRYLRGPPPV